MSSLMRKRNAVVVFGSRRHFSTSPPNQDGFFHGPKKDITSVVAAWISKQILKHPGLGKFNASIISFFYTSRSIIFDRVLLRNDTVPTVMTATQASQDTGRMILMFVVWFVPLMKSEFDSRARKVEDEKFKKSFELKLDEIVKSNKVELEKAMNELKKEVNDYHKKNQRFQQELVSLLEKKKEFPPFRRFPHDFSFQAYLQRIAGLNQQKKK